MQHKRSLCGEGRAFSHTGGRANLFPAEIEEIHCPRPLGGEGGLQPAFSSAGAGRVRGSKTLGPTETIPEVFVLTFAFCILRFDLFLRLRHDLSILVKTPSPPRQAERGAPSALRSPLPDFWGPMDPIGVPKSDSPKGARENESLVWRRTPDRSRAEPCSPHGSSANLDSECPCFWGPRLFPGKNH